MQGVQEIIDADDTYFDDGGERIAGDETYDSEKDEITDVAKFEPEIVMEHYDARRSNSTAGDYSRLLLPGYWPFYFSL